MPELDDTILWFRLAERAVLALLFICLSTILLCRYWRDRREQRLRIDSGAGGIALTLAKPFLAVLLLLGYIYASLSNPIVYEQNHIGTPPEVASQIRLFDDPRMTRLITELTLREGGLGPTQLPIIQSVYETAIGIAALRESGRGAEIDALLDDQDASLADIQARVRAMQRD